VKELIEMTAPKWVGYVALVLVIIGNVAGNLLLKIGSGADKTQELLFGRFPWQTLAGFMCFGLGVLVYSWALGRFELHVAQIVVSTQYVIAIGLASLLLGESISTQTWFGVGFIAVGLFLCVRQ
jgi:drug/metabolite transporter (DMT)-like permease